jgi:hypothetical protein
MLVAGVSRFHPDPLAAIEEARRNVRLWPLLPKERSGSHRTSWHFVRLAAVPVPTLGVN